MKKLLPVLTGVMLLTAGAAVYAASDRQASDPDVYEIGVSGMV